MDWSSNRFWLWILLAAAALAVVLIYRRRAGRADIHWPEMPELKWGGDAAAIETTMSEIYVYVVGFANSSIAWYQNRRRPKRSAGFLLRVGALVATVVAGLVPLFDDFGIKNVPVEVSTVLLALAGLCISIDTLAGYSSGWVRYMLAQQRIERCRDAFLMEWNALKLGLSTAQVMHERAKTFLLTVGKIVDDETQEWATEFQNALKELERARKAEADKPRSGAIEITVKNPELVEGWVLEIDGNERGRTSGKALAITDVFAGMRKARVHGLDRQGKTRSDEKIVKVEGGETAVLALELG